MKADMRIKERKDLGPEISEISNGFQLRIGLLSFYLLLTRVLLKGRYKSSVREDAEQFFLTTVRH